MNKFFLLTVVVLLISHSFVEAQPLNDMPQPRWTHQMTYDEANKQIHLFGGASSKKMLGDLWALNGSEWKKLSDTGPSARNKGVFVYDFFRKRSILFSGVNSEDKNMDDTWEWDGTKWNQLNVAGPVARAHAVGAYDLKNKVVLIFGGFGPDGALSDTWAFDGSNWKQLNADGPKNCMPHGMLYSEKEKAIILITIRFNSGSQNLPRKNEMWKWTGSSWKKLSYSAPSTSAASIQALSSFGNSGIVLYDGDAVSGNMATTWKFTQNKWTKHTIPGPGMRVGHAMIYDKKRKTTVLFGGSNRSEYFNDTWEWDGHEWKEIK